MPTTPSVVTKFVPSTVSQSGTGVSWTGYPQSGIRASYINYDFNGATPTHYLYWTSVANAQTSSKTFKVGGFNVSLPDGAVIKSMTIQMSGISEYGYYENMQTNADWACTSPFSDAFTAPSSIVASYNSDLSLLASFEFNFSFSFYGTIARQIKLNFLELSITYYIAKNIIVKDTISVADSAGSIGNYTGKDEPTVDTPSVTDTISLTKESIATPVGPASSLNPIPSVRGIIMNFANVNTDTSLPSASFSSTMPFSSFMYHPSLRYLYAGDSRKGDIIELNGQNTFDGDVIDAFYQRGFYNFTINQVKKYRYHHASITSDSPLSLTVYRDNDTASTTVTITPQSQGLGLMNANVKTPLSRDMRSTYTSFKISNNSLGYFKIRDEEVDVLPKEKEESD